MTRDEIREIADIVGGDRTYRHFVHRINKEFDIADEDRNARVQVLFEEFEDKNIGFCVIGVSHKKMKMWGKVFKEEGWVADSFEIDPESYELMYMYVRPEFRKKGIGKKILGKAFNYTRDQGVTDIYAYVSDRTRNALEFYKQMKADIICDLSDDDATTAFVHFKVPSKHQ